MQIKIQEEFIIIEYQTYLFKHKFLDDILHNVVGQKDDLHNCNLTKQAFPHTIKREITSVRFVRRLDGG